jgi:two-component system, cell cycle sensor histidine kinase and response regulator CckA
MHEVDQGLSARILKAFGLHHVAHRPPLTWRFWIYAITAYLLPVIVLVVFPSEGSSLDEIVWLVTLVPAFLLSLHFGLRGAFIALLVGVGLLVSVEIFLTLAGRPGDPRIIAPIFLAFGALAISVGWLSEQLHEHYEAALEAQAAQKAEALGTMAAGIAHDFNNILTAMVANAELLADGSTSEVGETPEELRRLKGAARRGAGIVRNLLGFSRSGMLALRPLDLGRLAEKERASLLRLLPETVELEIESEPELPAVLADKDAVSRLLVNLVTNARNAMPAGGTIRLQAHRCRIEPEDRRSRGWGDPGEYACVSVQDTGVGMEETEVARIFEPFFTGGMPGEGVGLGMAMVYGIMKQHRGFVDVRSTPGAGTTARLYFPVAKDRSAAPEQEAVARPVGGTETILLVEDEDAIRSSGRRILERLGYTVLDAADGEEALSLCLEHAGEIDLLLTDVILPKRTGTQLYEAIRQEPGAPPVLFMSGYPARTVQRSASLDPSLPFLAKPWTVADLTHAVRAVLDTHAPSRVGTTPERG